jgi:hypothetical protein
MRKCPEKFKVQGSRFKEWGAAAYEAEPLFRLYGRAKIHEQLFWEIDRENTWPNLSTGVISI